MTVFFGPLPASPVATVTQARGWTRGLGGGSGVYATDYGLYTTDLVCTDGGSLDVAVAAGEAVVDGIYYTSDASQTVTLDAADPSNPRIDLVVVELDPTAGTVALDKVTGTPAASPSAPAVTQSESGVFQIALAEVTVPAGSAVLGTITDVRTFVAPGSATSVPDPSGEADGRILEVATGELVYADPGGVQVVTGNYTGDGTTGRTIPLAFTPKLVIVSFIQSGNYFSVGHHSANKVGLQNGTATTADEQRPEPTTNGFVVTGAAGGQLNISGFSYFYTAIG